MDLKSVSDEELRQELERREKEKRQVEKPVMLENPDLTQLKKTCQSYVDFIDDDEEFHSDNDFMHYIYESAMGALFGEKFWQWYSKKVN